jgi:hypothetical protein
LQFIVLRNGCYSVMSRETSRLPRTTTEGLYVNTMHPTAMRYVMECAPQLIDWIFI